MKNNSCTTKESINDLLALSKKIAASFVRFDPAGEAEYLSAGNEAIAQAVNSYNAKRGELRHFAAKIVKCKMIDAWNKRQKQQAESLDATHPETNLCKLDLITAPKVSDFNFDLEQKIIIEITEFAVNSQRIRFDKTLFNQWVELSLIKLLPNRIVNKSLQITGRQNQYMRDAFRYHACRWYCEQTPEIVEQIKDSPIICWLKKTGIRILLLIHKF